MDKMSSIAALQVMVLGSGHHSAELDVTHDT